MQSVVGTQHKIKHIVLLVGTSRYLKLIYYC